MNYKFTCAGLLVYLIILIPSMCLNTQTGSCSSTSLHKFNLIREQIEKETKKKISI